MLLFPVGVVELAPMIDMAHQTVLIQSASVSALPLLERLRQARGRKVGINVLLGPKPAYEMVDGKVSIGNKPYSLHAGAELDALNEMGAEYLINPEFNELQGTDIKPGAASHATYLVADQKKALICTGSFSTTAIQREANVCAQTENPNIVRALSALFFSEFDEALSPDRKDAFKQVAASQLIVCPMCEAQLLAELKDAKDLTLRIAGFGDLPNIEQRLLTLAPRLRLLLPASYQGHHPLEDRLRRAGALIRFVDRPYDGVTWFYRTAAGAERAFIGSMQFNSNSLNLSREVGLVLTNQDATDMADLLRKQWAAGRK